MAFSSGNKLRVNLKIVTFLDDVSPQSFYQCGIVMASTMHNSKFTLSKTECISKISIQLKAKNNKERSVEESFEVVQKRHFDATTRKGGGEVTVVTHGGGVGFTASTFTGGAEVHGCY